MAPYIFLSVSSEKISFLSNIIKAFQIEKPFFIFEFRFRYLKLIDKNY